MPMIFALRNPGMRDRHWKKLSRMLGFDVVCSTDFTAKSAIELKLTNYIAQCEEVSSPIISVLMMSNILPCCLCSQQSMCLENNLLI